MKCKSGASGLYLLLQTSYLAATAAAAESKSYNLGELTGVIHGVTAMSLQPSESWVTSHLTAALALLPSEISLAGCSTLVHAVARLGRSQPSVNSSQLPGLTVDWLLAVADFAVGQLPNAVAAVAAEPSHRCRCHYSLLLFGFGRAVALLPPEAAAEARLQLRPMVTAVASFLGRLLQLCGPSDLVQIAEGLARLGCRPGPGFMAAHAAAVEGYVKGMDCGILWQLRAAYQALGVNPSGEFARQLLLRL
jgi:hypothetical protein